MKHLLIAVTALLTSSIVVQAGSDEFRFWGPEAEVIDGDTFRVGDKIIDLWAIDAPELDQLCLNSRREPYYCGRVAADVLRGILASKRDFACRYEGLIGAWRCESGPDDISQQMVIAGYAVAATIAGIKTTIYADEELRASLSDTGMWAAPNLLPEEPGRLPTVEVDRP